MKKFVLRIVPILSLSISLAFIVLVANANPYTDAQKNWSNSTKKLKQITSNLEGVNREFAELSVRLHNIENVLLPNAKADVKKYTEQAEITASRAKVLTEKYLIALKYKNELEASLKEASFNADKSKNEILNIVRTQIKNQSGSTQLSQNIFSGTFEQFLKDMQTDDLVKRNLARIFSESKLTLTEGMNTQQRLAVVSKIVTERKKAGDAANKKATELKAKAIQEAEKIKSLEQELSRKKVEFAAAKQRLKTEQKQAKAEEAAYAKKAREEYEKYGGNGQDLGPIPTKGWFGAPLSSMVVAWGFGPRNTGIPGASTYHLGVDLNASCGQKIYAAQTGRVQESGYMGATGNYVLVNHGKHSGTTLLTRYLHMSRRAASVGQTVSKGQVIGYVGETGIAVGCHLHFEVIKNYYPNNVNPMLYY